MIILVHALAAKIYRKHVEMVQIWPMMTYDINIKFNEKYWSAFERVCWNITIPFCIFLALLVFELEEHFNPHYNGETGPDTTHARDKRWCLLSK